MLHSVIIANEVVEEAKRGQKSCLVFKVDFERAYDPVSWDFLIYMLHRMGFCNMLMILYFLMRAPCKMSRSSKQS